MFQVKITGWIFHGVYVVRGELLRDIVYKSAIFIYFDIQKTFYCWINICSKIRKRSFVSLTVFMFKKNPKKPPFLWATVEETPLSRIQSYDHKYPTICIVLSMFSGSSWAQSKAILCTMLTPSPEQKTIESHFTFFPRSSKSPFAIVCLL